MTTIKRCVNCGDRFEDQGAGDTCSDQCAREFGELVIGEYEAHLHAVNTAKRMRRLVLGVTS